MIAAVTVGVGVGVHALIAPPVRRSRRGPAARPPAGALPLRRAARLFRLRAKALSPAITEARLQALQARIRPHFLFNSINAVLSLVRTDPRRAERRSRTWPTCSAC